MDRGAFGFGQDLVIVIIVPERRGNEGGQYCRCGFAQKVKSWFHAEDVSEVTVSRRRRLRSRGFVQKTSPKSWFRAKDVSEVVVPSKTSSLLCMLSHSRGKDKGVAYGLKSRSRERAVCLLVQQERRRA